MFLPPLDPHILYNIVNINNSVRKSGGGGEKKIENIKKNENGIEKFAKKILKK